MKIKCDYCGSYVDDSVETCPNCGATISAPNRFANGVPQTIEQLQQWYKDRNLPPEDVTRFFIGKNITEPKAFGIYKDSNGDVVVYKNKSDGSRAVRYQGSDEAYGVKELYERLKEEIANQKSLNASRQSALKDKSTLKDSKYQSHYSIPIKAKNVNDKLFRIFIIYMIFSVIVGAYLPFYLNYKLSLSLSSPCQGHYRYESDYGTQIYYFQDNVWYRCDDGKWRPIDKSSTPKALRDARYGSPLYMETEPENSFCDSEYYIMPEKDKYIKDGYYRYGADTYYNQYDDWYIYDYSTSQWSMTTDVPSDLDTDYRGNYSYDWTEGETIDYKDTGLYDAAVEKHKYDSVTSSGSSSSFDSSWDSGSDWDSGSTWDSGGTDWDSDW